MALKYESDAQKVASRNYSAKPAYPGNQLKVRVGPRAGGQDGVTLGKLPQTKAIFNILDKAPTIAYKTRPQHTRQK